MTSIVKSYHGLVLGLLVENSRDYILCSNRESGYGRYDVILEPKNGKGMAVILEFKVFNARRGEKNLKDTVESALQQIEDMRYETELRTRGIPVQNILKYGLVFQGKECLIQKAGN